MRIINIISRKLFKLFYGNFGAKITLVINAMLGKKERPTLNVHLDEDGIVKIVNMPEDISNKFTKLDGIRIVHDNASDEMKFIILDALNAVRRGMPTLVDQVNQEFNKLDEEYSGIKVEINLEKKKKKKKINPKLLSRKGVNKERIVFEISQQNKKRKLKLIKKKNIIQQQEKNKDKLKNRVLSSRYWKIYQFRRKIVKVIKKVSRTLYMIRNATAFDRTFGRNRNTTQQVIQQPITVNAIVEYNNYIAARQSQNSIETNHISTKTDQVESPVVLKKDNEVSNNIAKELSESYNSKISDFIQNLFSSKSDKVTIKQHQEVSSEVSGKDDKKNYIIFNIKKDVPHKESHKNKKKLDNKKEVNYNSHPKEKDIRERYKITTEVSCLSTGR